MSYTGLHRRSPLGRIGSWITGMLQLAVVFWVTFQGFMHARQVPNIFLFEAGLLGLLVVAVVIHECGHLLVGLAGGEPVRKLRIGSGATLFGFRIGSLPVQVCINLLGGGAVYFSAGVAPGIKRLASLVAGPFVNLLAGSYSLFLYQYTGEAWLGVFALANGITFLSSAVPSTSRAGGQEHPSDGMQILSLLLRPEERAEAPNFEAAVLTDDARDVMVRAAQDAILSGSAEVTEDSLLRALNEDAVVGALFASTGLADRIPTAPLAGSDAMVQPHFSLLAHAALEAAFKQGQDMGVDRPNAACICLGLLLTDNPAAKQMKEAGVTEAAVRKLASVVEQDGEDARRAGVLSPDLPLERWGTAAENALAYAFRVAAADGSQVVSTQHLLAALVADPQCRAAQALTRTGFILRWTPGTAEARDEAEPGGPIMSPELGLAVAGAIWRTGPTFPTGTAELCLGIVDQNAGAGAALMVHAGVTVHALESALRSTPREPSYPAGCTADSHGLWMLRGQAREKAGRWLDARADFVEAGRVVLSDWQRALCRNNIAWVSLMSGDPSLRAESLEHARFAVSVKPDLAAFLGTYAFALLENGSPAEAATTLESSLPKVTRPRHRAYNLCELAMCYARMNQPDAAARSVAAAAEVDPECPLLARARAELGAVAA